MKSAVYIDRNNLYRAATAQGYRIDYKRFYGWLRQKYSSPLVYLFIGYIPERAGFYDLLSSYGYKLVFKETVMTDGVVKGNCDAELVLTSATDFYAENVNKFYIVTGDGDFGCLVKFLKENNVLGAVLAPQRKKCSILLRNKNIPLVYLDDQYRKFGSKIVI